jgi:erythronate-4-phosphate dehydrogenase
MKIIVDENIAFAEEAFEKIGSVKLMYGREISNKDLKNVNALIVRSITKVNENLLRDTNVKFVGTATIGTDHIDLNYLKNADITFTDAKGCNANAVVEYVFNTISIWLKLNNKKFKDLTLGVVGVGEIGSKVVNIAKKIGMNVLMNDPPRERNEKSNKFVPLNKIFDADIITTHTPLIREGIDKTVHLYNKDNVFKVKDKTLFINASRGEVVDNILLLELLKQKNITVALDVWENEPNINTALLEKVFIATPHVAGYSLEGKVIGTKMIYDKLCKFINQTPEWHPVTPQVSKPVIEISSGQTLEDLFSELFPQLYDIIEDTSHTKELLKAETDKRGKFFDDLRKNYKLKREFCNYTIKLNPFKKEYAEILESFRFKVI